MNKQSYKPEIKADVVRLIFTDTSITTEQICDKTGIHPRTLSLWKSTALKSIPDYLLSEFGEDEMISAEGRAEATADFLRYDCDIDELADEYSINEDKIQKWSTSVLDNLGNVFARKRQTGSSPIKSKRPKRLKKQVNDFDISSLVSGSSSTTDDELPKQEL